MKKDKNDKVRSTLIGGQAIMEGVLMRGASVSVMTVRNSHGDMVSETRRLSPRRWYNRVPLVRGCVSFVSSLVIGTRALLRSTEVAFPEEETPGKGAFAFATVLGVALAIALFIFLPSLLVGFIPVVKDSVLVSSLLEGVARIVIFVVYLLAVSRMKDIRRTFMYHGAEHRTINCYEKGLPLTVENVQKCSTRHNRCGTTFLFFVMIVSILLFSLATWLLSVLGWTHSNVFVNNLIRLGVRLALLPLVAGLSFELLRFLALLPDNKFTAVLRAPGLALQRLTTYPPDDDMARVAIRSFELVLEADADPNIKDSDFGEMKMTELRSSVAARLAAAGIEDESEADWLIAEVLSLKRGELGGIDRVTPEQYESVTAASEARAAHKPLDYITGVSEFYGERLKVNEHVHLPRQETERLAETVIEEIRSRGGKPRVLDLMTGSGCIARAIAVNTDAEVCASDISRRALEVAKTNLEGLDVKLFHSDMFAQMPGETFDIIVANPPYIPTAVIDGLSEEVRCQPRRALDGGADGLEFYVKIVGSTDRLREGGAIFVEIGYDQGESAAKIFAEKFDDVRVTKDYSGNDRVLSARGLKAQNAHMGAEKQ